MQITKVQLTPAQKVELEYQVYFGTKQSFEYKHEKLQNLVNQFKNGWIELYFGDESHICTSGYVPYGWQFPGENVFIPSQKGNRLNIIEMFNYESDYNGFATTASMTSLAQTTWNDFPTP